MLTKISLLSSGLMIIQPSLNALVTENNHLSQNSQVNSYFDVKNLIVEVEKQVIKYKIMNLEQFAEFKSLFLNSIDKYFTTIKNQKLIQYNHIFDGNFWVNELKFWWKLTNLYIWMSSNAIEQFTEAINMGFTATAFIAGLGTIIPGIGLAVGAYIVANMAVWRHLDKGKGVVSRYLFAVIPTGYWAEE